eukprot:11368-Pelagomonas_calceolata.AAC.1
MMDFNVALLSKNTCVRVTEDCGASYLKTYGGTVRIYHIVLGGWLMVGGLGSCGGQREGSDLDRSPLL